MDRNIGARSAQKPAGNGESKACRGWFGREKRLENAAKHIFGEAATAVVEQNRCVLLIAIGVQVQSATLVHRFGGVGEQVMKSLLRVPGVAVNREVGREFIAHFDVVTQRAIDLQFPGELAQRLSDIEEFGMREGRFYKRGKLGQNPVHTPRFFGDDIEKHRALLIETLTTLKQSGSR